MAKPKKRRTKARKPFGLPRVILRKLSFIKDRERRAEFEQEAWVEYLRDGIEAANRVIWRLEKSEKKYQATQRQFSTIGAEDVKPSERWDWITSKVDGTLARDAKRRLPRRKPRKPPAEPRPCARPGCPWMIGPGASRNRKYHDNACKQAHHRELKESAES